MTRQKTCSRTMRFNKSIAQSNAMRVGCLHTAYSNIAIFDAAALELGTVAVHLRHTVRSDLLEAAEKAGYLTADIETQTKAALLDLCQDNDVVILTCSTLGPSVDDLSTLTTTPVIRVDEALAQKAVGLGGRVVALCAVETTIEPTSELFLKASRDTTSTVKIQWVPHAWALFKAGNTRAYLEMIAQAANDAYREGAEVVALAQASMAQAAKLVTDHQPPLTSPICGLQAAILAVK